MKKRETDEVEELMALFVQTESAEEADLVEKELRALLARSISLVKVLESRGVFDKDVVDGHPSGDEVWQVDGRSRDVADGRSRDVADGRSRDVADGSSRKILKKIKNLFLNSKQKQYNFLNPENSDVEVNVVSDRKRVDLIGPSSEGHESMPTSGVSEHTPTYSKEEKAAMFSYLKVLVDRRMKLDEIRAGEVLFFEVFEGYTFQMESDYVSSLVTNAGNVALASTGKVVQVAQLAVGYIPVVGSAASFLTGIVAARVGEHKIKAKATAVAKIASTVEEHREMNIDMIINLLSHDENKAKLRKLDLSPQNASILEKIKNKFKGIKEKLEISFQAERIETMGQKIGVILAEKCLEEVQKDINSLDGGYVIRYPKMEDRCKVLEKVLKTAFDDVCLEYRSMSSVVEIDSANHLDSAAVLLDSNFDPVGTAYDSTGCVSLSGDSIEPTDSNSVYL